MKILAELLNLEEHYHALLGWEISILHAAVKYGSLEAIDMLLDFPMCPSAFAYRDKLGRTPLRYAARSELGPVPVFFFAEKSEPRPTTVPLLLEQGWSPYNRDEMDLLPIHYAAIKLNKNNIELLSARGPGCGSETHGLNIILLLFSTIK
jgi:hypothetical protein